MSDKEIMSSQLIGLQNHFNKIVTRVNGDDFTPSLIQEIKDSLHALDNNSASQEINKEHFDKLILICKDSCERLSKLTQYITYLNIRYTSKDANKNLLDKMLTDFTMANTNITVQMPKGSEIIDNNKSQLPKDNIDFKEKI